MPRTFPSECMETSRRQAILESSYGKAGVHMNCSDEYVNLDNKLI